MKSLFQEQSETTMEQALQLEKEIIRLFVRREKQHRMFWELDNPQKASGALAKMWLLETFKPQCMHKIPRMSEHDLAKYLIRLGAERPICYDGMTAEWNTDWDYIQLFRNNVSIQQALNGAAEWGTPYYLYFGNGILYYEADAMDYSPSERQMIFLANGRKLAPFHR